MRSTTPHDDGHVQPPADAEATAPAGTTPAPAAHGRVVPLRRAPTTRMTPPTDDDDPGPQAA